MEEKKVVAPKKKKAVKKRVAKKPKTPISKSSGKESPPGKLERTLMFLARILKFLLGVVEKKIVYLKSRRLAKRMDRK